MTPNEHQMMSVGVPADAFEMFKQVREDFYNVNQRIAELEHKRRDVAKRLEELAKEVGASAEAALKEAQGHLPKEVMARERDW